MEINHNIGKIGSLVSIDTTSAPPYGVPNIFSIVGTGGLVIPYGTTGERPSHQTGLLRYNTDNASIEISNGVDTWTDVATLAPNAILEAIKTVDGTGSGLDADLLDGYSSSDFLRKDVNETTTGSLAIGSVSSTSDTSLSVTAGDSYSASVQIFGSSQGTGIVYVGQSNTQGGGIAFNGDDNPDVPYTVDSVSFFRRFGGTDYEVLQYNANSNNITTTGNVNGRDMSADGSKLDGIEAGATADQTGSEILSALLTVDGPGSGLDAENLNGQSASYYLDYTNFTNTPDIYKRNWVSVSSNHNAVAGTSLAINTTSSAITVTLPSTPSIGDVVGFFDVHGNSSSNTISVQRNSNLIMGLAEDMTVSLDYASLDLVYIDSTTGWFLFSYN